MKKLSVKKKGRAIIVKYYDLVDAWSIGVPFARRLIKSVNDLEIKAQELISANSWNFTKEAVVAYWFASLDSISTGIDIRSNTNFNELSVRFINAYADKYFENKKFCEETHEFVNNAGEKDSYLSDWKRYDKCNELNKKFNFGFPSISNHSFKYDELDKMLELTGTMLDILNKRDENK